MEDILDGLRPAIKNAQAIWMSVAHKEHQKVLCPGSTTKFCTTLFADRNQRLELCPPNALHRTVSCPGDPAVNTGDQSAPNNKRVDSVQTSSRAASSRKRPVEVYRCVCTTARDGNRSRSPEVSTRHARAHSLLLIFDTLDTTGSGCLSMSVEGVTLRVDD